MRCVMCDTLQEGSVEVFDRSNSEFAILLITTGAYCCELTLELTLLTFYRSTLTVLLRLRE